jgi:hypothetical protein
MIKVYYKKKYLLAFEFGPVCIVAGKEIYGVLTRRNVLGLNECILQLNWAASD